MQYLSIVCRKEDQQMQLQVRFLLRRHMRKYLQEKLAQIRPRIRYTWYVRQKIRANPFCDATRKPWKPTSRE